PSLLAHGTEEQKREILPRIVRGELVFCLGMSEPGAGSDLAASEPALWTEIFLMNRDELLPALRSLEEPLGELERALEAGDEAALAAWLRRGAEWRGRLDA